MYQIGLVTTLQFLIIILGAPLLTGLIRRFKAILQGRTGASVLQPYHDLIKLFRKAEVVPEDASPLFKIVPVACVGSLSVASAMVPLLTTHVIGPTSDFLLLVYLLILCRFLTLLGSLEGGSCFGGMAASRESMLSTLVEPAALLAVMGIASITGSTDIGVIAATFGDSGIDLVGPTLLLATASFFITLLAENSRMPFDNPATHLELTMVHEGMVLEYSGRSLGLMEYASMLRLMVMTAVMIAAFTPWGIITGPTDSVLVAWSSFAIKLGLMAFFVAMIESNMAKTRLFRLPNLLTASFTLALLAIMTDYIL